MEETESDTAPDKNAIDAPESDYLFSDPSQLPGSGNGLFTAIRIYRDEIIAVFTGEILTEEEAEIREQAGADKYFMTMEDGSTLDTMPIAGFAKYANDATGFSNSLFKNNARITLDDNGNVCLIALRQIQAGEEIFCSYGKKYWQKHG